MLDRGPEASTHDLGSELTQIGASEPIDLGSACRVDVASRLVLLAEW